jgi:hypothetical protein
MEPLGLCVEKMGYVSVSHLLSLNFPKHVAFLNIFYSLFQILITRSTNNGTLLDRNASTTSWDLWVCVWKKWGTSLFIICSLGLYTPFGNGEGRGYTVCPSFNICLTHQWKFAAQMPQIIHGTSGFLCGKNGVRLCGSFALLEFS